MIYELTFLLEDEKETQTIKDLLETLKIKLIKEDSWGKRSLAYDIKKLSHASFFCWQMEVKKDQVGELKTKLNYNEKLIRHLLLKID